jgi:hypothetical protein
MEEERIAEPPVVLGRVIRWLSERNSEETSNEVLGTRKCARCRSGVYAALLFVT